MDLDNLVLCKEFNTFEQARSRVSFTALTGTPVTLGDALPELPLERVELLKRVLPVADLHPMDLVPRAADLHAPLLLNARIARPYDLTLHVPNGFRARTAAAAATARLLAAVNGIQVLRLGPEETGSLRWSVAFTQS